MIQQVSCRPLTIKARVRSQAPRPVRVRFVVGNKAPERVLLRVLPFSPVSIIRPMPHTHFNPALAVAGRTNGRSQGTLYKALLFGNRGALD